MNSIKKSIFLFITALYVIFALFKNDALGVIIDKFNNEKFVQADPQKASIIGDNTIDINELLLSKKSSETSIECDFDEQSIRNFLFSCEQEIKRIQFLNTPPPERKLNILNSLFRFNIISLNFHEDIFISCYMFRNPTC
jgi:hypothetical protein